MAAAAEPRVSDAFRYYTRVYPERARVLTRAVQWALQANTSSADVNDVQVVATMMLLRTAEGHDGWNWAPVAVLVTPQGSQTPQKHHILHDLDVNIYIDFAAKNLPQLSQYAVAAGRRRAFEPFGYSWTLDDAQKLVAQNEHLTAMQHMMQFLNAQTGSAFAAKPTQTALQSAIDRFNRTRTFETRRISSYRRRHHHHHSSSSSSYLVCNHCNKKRCICREVVRRKKPKREVVYFMK